VIDGSVLTGGLVFYIHICHNHVLNTWKRQGRREPASPADSRLLTAFKNVVWNRCLSPGTALFAAEAPDVPVLRSANVLLFADKGARYVFRPPEFTVRPEPDAYALEQSSAPGVYLRTEKANATADAATVLCEASVQSNILSRRHGGARAG
jgi:hypothetical protein